MRLLDNIFQRKKDNAGADALPDPLLIKQIVSAIISEPPDGIAKDQALPTNWLSITYQYYIKEAGPDGSFAASAEVWATMTDTPEQAYAVGRQAGLLMAQLYQYMHGKHQEWLSCKVTITRKNLESAPSYAVDFER